MSVSFSQNSEIPKSWLIILVLKNVVDINRAVAPSLRGAVFDLRGCLSDNILDYNRECVAGLVGRLRREQGNEPDSAPADVYDPSIK